MRPAGFTLAALLVGVTAAWAQPPAAPPGAPPAPNTARLDAHLAGWEKTMGDVKNFRVELALKRSDPAATGGGVFKTDKDYTGVVLCMKPNYAVLRLDYTADLNDKDKKKKDYEAYICDGKAVYAYNGLQETITQYKLPDPKTNPGGGTDNLMLDFLSGMKAKVVKERFDITLFKEDEYYVYLDIKPLLGKDLQEFKQIRLALYGPNTKFAYLPAQVYMLKPNDSTEQWKFTNPQTNISGVDEKVFQYKDVPGFRFQKAPEQPPPGRPGQPLPPGGAVRPNR